MISIIGAGPVGSFAAYLLAKEGLKVSIFEEHEEIGLPVQCTGLVTEKLFELVPLKNEFTINHLNKVQVSSENNSAEVPVKEFLLDRQKFDSYLLNKAVNAGAKLHLSHKFMEYSNGEAVFKNNDEIKKVKTKILVGADGPLSNVAKTAGLYGKRNFYIGMQAMVEGSFDKHKYETFFGKPAPGFFAWIVPESSTRARIGLATRYNCREYFEKLLKDRGKVIETQAGIIPVYNNKQQVQKDNIYLIGDAAGFCKATTGGGLVSGLESAKVLANCIIHKKDYPQSIRKIKQQLWLHSSLRSMLDRFNEKDYDKLVSMINNPKIKAQLAKHSRDNPIALVLKLLLKEPRFLLFAKCLLQKKKAF